MGIKYLAPTGFSGYAEWAKNVIVAISKVVDMEFCPIKVDETRKMDETNADILCHKLSLNRPEYDVVFQHLVPLNYLPFREHGKINVGVTIWETDRLYHDWVNKINCMAAVIVPSEWNKKIFLMSGVLVPIYVLPFVYEEPIKIEATINGLRPDDYKFYTIGQWSERKGIDLAIDYFCKKFTADDKVCFIVKTYEANFTEHCKNIIRYRVNEILGRYTNPPRVLLLLNDFSRKQMQAIHNIGDCYLSLTFSEGWGMGAYDAALAGKPVIISDFGAQIEFVPNELLVRTVPASVNMPNITWYDPKMNWGKAVYESFSEKMDTLLESKEKFNDLARQNSQVLKDRYSEKTINELFIDILTKIRKHGPKFS